MAASILPAPGSKLGPCTSKCQHTDCAMTRKMAAEKCCACGELIGYECPYYSEHDGRMVHASCLQDSLLNSYYYTFGSDLAFPHCGGWVEVRASSWEEAHTKFRAHFPDRPGHEGILNCAFFYDQDNWNKTIMAKGSTEERCHEIII